MTLQGLFDAICETFSEEEAHAALDANEKLIYELKVYAIHGK